MIVSGTFLLGFLVYHLLHFKWGDYVSTTQDGVEMRDLGATVIHEFGEGYEVALYVVAMLIIGAHLWHGVRSALETLNLPGKRWDCLFSFFCKAYVIVVMGGFILIPLWIYFFAGASS